MVPETETKAGADFNAGVKHSRLTYYTPDDMVTNNGIGSHRMTPQPGVPPEECGAAITANWSSVLVNSNFLGEFLQNGIVGVTICKLGLQSFFRLTSLIFIATICTLYLDWFLIFPLKLRSLGNHFLEFVCFLFPVVGNGRRAIFFSLPLFYGYLCWVYSPPLWVQLAKKQKKLTKKQLEKQIEALVRPNPLFTAVSSSDSFGDDNSSLQPEGPVRLNANASDQGSDNPETKDSPQLPPDNDPEQDDNLDPDLQKFANSKGRVSNLTLAELMGVQRQEIKALRQQFNQVLISRETDETKVSLMTKLFSDLREKISSQFDSIYDLVNDALDSGIRTMAYDVNGNPVDLENEFSRLRDYLENIFGDSIDSALASYNEDVSSLLSDIMEMLKMLLVGVDGVKFDSQTAMELVKRVDARTEDIYALCLKARDVGKYKITEIQRDFAAGVSDLNLQLNVILSQLEALNTSVTEIKKQTPLNSLNELREKFLKTQAAPPIDVSVTDISSSVRGGLSLSDSALGSVSTPKLRPEDLRDATFAQLAALKAASPNGSMPFTVPADGVIKVIVTFNDVAFVKENGSYTNVNTGETIGIEMLNMMKSFVSYKTVLFFGVVENSGSITYEQIADRLHAELWTKNLRYLCNSNFMLSTIQIQQVEPTKARGELWQKSYTEAGKLDPIEDPTSLRAFTFSVTAFGILSGLNDFSIRFFGFSQKFENIFSSSQAEEYSIIHGLASGLAQPVIIRSGFTSLVHLIPAIRTTRTQYRNYWPIDAVSVGGFLGAGSVQNKALGVKKQLNQNSNRE